MTRISPPPFHTSYQSLLPLHQTTSSAPLPLFFASSLLRFFVLSSTSPQSNNPATAAITRRPPTPIPKSNLVAAPLNTTVPAPTPAPELALGVVWLIIAVKSGVIAPVLVVAETSAPQTPNVAEGTAREEVSTARISMVAVLVAGVVDAVGSSVVVGIAVEEDEGRMKDKRAAQVA
jgi:hypothetical protein